MKERVTVCLCAYNHEAYIRDALDRLASQTYEHFKIVACDDGSADATYDILKEYESGKLAGKLIVLTHKGRVNRGIYATYNLCLERVDTEFFMGHASDDFLERDALEYLVGILDINTQVDFAYGQCKVVDVRGCDAYKFDGSEEIGVGLEAAEKLMFCNPLREPTMIYRRNCLSILLNRPASLVYGDWYQNVLLFLERNPIYYSKAVVNYRVHFSNVSIGRDDSLKRRFEVAEALYERSDVVKHSALKLRLLSLLAASEHASISQKIVHKEIKSVMRGFSDNSQRERALMDCWFACVARGDCPQFFRALSWSEGLKVLSQSGSAEVCSQIKRMAVGASMLDKVNLINKLSIFLGLRFFLILRAFIRAVLQIISTK